MRTRASFWIGGVTGAVLVAVGAVVLRPGHAEETQRVRLLVGCDEGARARLLEALRPLPVTVFDLDRMLPIEVRPAEAPPAVASATAAADALAVYAAVLRAMEAVAKEGRPESPFQVRSVDIHGGRAAIEFALANVDVLDAVARELRNMQGLGEVDVVRGPVQRDAGGFRCSFDVRYPSAPWTSPGVAPASGTTVSQLALATVRAALENAGVTVNAVSAEVATVDGDMRWTSARFTVRAVTLDKLFEAVLAINALPGHRTTGMNWKIGASPAGSVPSTIEVTARLSR